MTWLQTIEDLHPCRDALDWLRTQPDPKTAWCTCARADWMLWLIGSVMGGVPSSPERRRLSACCADVAETVLPIYEQGYPSDRPRKAIEAARRGDPEECRAAAGAAYAAADAYAYAAGAAYAAADAAAAAYAYAYAAADAYADAYAAADAAAYAAADAAAAAYAYAYADADAYADAYAAARSASLARSADIVRRHYPEPPIKEKP